MRQQTRPSKEPAEKVVHPAVEKLEIIQLVEQSHLPVRIRPCNDIEDAGIKPRDLEAVLPRRRHRAAAAPTVERLTLERPQRSADLRHDVFPGMRFRLRINQVDAMDRPAGVGGKIAPAVENEPLAGRGDREEGSRHPLVVQSGTPNAQIVIQVARRGVAEPRSRGCRWSARCVRQRC